MTVRLQPVDVGCKSPFATNNMWIETPLGLMGQGDIISTAIYSVLAVFCFLNRALMELEDIVLPSLKTESMYSAR